MNAQPYATFRGGLDLVAIERVLAGTLPHTDLSPREKKYAAQNSGESAKVVSRALGVAEKTISRWREESNGAPASPPDGGDE